MEKTLLLFEKIAKKLLEKELNEPVAPFLPVEAIDEVIDITLHDEGLNDEKFEALVTQITLSTPRTATTGFFNQLFGGRNDKAVLGDLLAVLLNNSMYTYKAAGIQVALEKQIIDKICNMIGWHKQSGGVIASGGSMTNFMAMLMARDAKASSIRDEGVTKKMIVYTSVESHYSIPKNAMFCGIGRNQVRYIPVNNKGEIIPEALEKAIIDDVKQGNVPTLINATAGTTVLGAFDPIEPLTVISCKYNIWLHVDGAYCGSVIFSKKYKKLINGINKVNSFSLNAHKMLGTPLTCSLIFVENKKHLYQSFANDASYLYQTDDDDYNPGKMSLQCGRRNDALKLYTLWKSIGTNGLEYLVNKQFELAEIARNYIDNNPNYRLYSFEDSISVCFNYKNIPANIICTQLYEQSKLLVGYGNFNDVEFIRLVTINAQNEPEDILNFFKTLEEFVDNNINATSLTILRQTQKAFK